MSTNRYVLLDRDGTINVEKHHLSDPDDIEILPGVVSGLKRLMSYGLKLLIITNQSVIGRGMINEDKLRIIHERLEEILEKEGITFAGIYYCPHKPDENCQCRKPEPGLVIQAAQDFDFDPSKAFLIGDKSSDIELGQRFGMTTFLVETGYGAEEETSGNTYPDFVVSTVDDAAEIIKKLLLHETKKGFPMVKYSQERYRKHILSHIETMNHLLDTCQQDVLSAAELIINSIKDGGKLMLCGNGGSAADSQHIAGEFVNLLNQSFPRPGIPAIALTTDTSILTSNANDFGFEGVFERQVQALGNKNDVLIGISTSGNSKNVIKAIQYSINFGIKTIGLTGGEGGKLSKLADLVIKVPSQNVQHIQEAHITIGHILCDLVEKELYKDQEEE